MPRALSGSVVRVVGASARPTRRSAPMMAIAPRRGLAGVGPAETIPAQRKSGSAAPPRGAWAGTVRLANGRKTARPGRFVSKELASCPDFECGYQGDVFCGDCPPGEFCGPAHRCVVGECDPRATWCEGSELWTCYGPIGPLDVCDSSEVCVPGSASCVLPCAEGEPFCADGALGICGADGRSLTSVTRDCRAEDLDCSRDGCGKFWRILFNGYGAPNGCSRPGMVGSIFKALGPRILTGVATVGDVVGEAHFTFRVHRGLAEDGPFEQILEQSISVLGEAALNPRMIESEPIHLQLAADEYYAVTVETLDSLGTLSCIQGSLVQEYGGLAHVGKGYELPAYPVGGLGSPLTLTAPIQLEYFELVEP